MQPTLFVAAHTCSWTMLCGLWATTVLALSIFIRNRVALIVVPYIMLLLAKHLGHRLYVAMRTNGHEDLVFSLTLIAEGSPRWVLLPRMAHFAVHRPDAGHLVGIAAAGKKKGHLMSSTGRRAFPHLILSDLRCGGRQVALRFLALAMVANVLCFMFYTLVAPGRTEIVSPSFADYIAACVGGIETRLPRDADSFQIACRVVVLVRSYGIYRSGLPGAGP